MHWKGWLAFFLVALGALAQGELRLDLKAFRVVSLVQEGKTVERLEMATEARPGAVVEYQLVATNPTDRPIRQGALVIPIPLSTFYQAESAGPLSWKGQVILPEFSFDGGQSYGRPPLKRTLTVIENGKEVRKEVEVRPEEYTHVRWIVPEIGPKESLTLKLRAIVR
ncbi:hypothetical protein DV704_00950 [Meiothermus sp. QL-1]|uniref:hypothetical protein n=1 Tax=Meiothermus sp. QL-1 TaxID=2058095 RepID=UPI000E0A27C1|nr:hypothetical protein [Meiothermus sp. QL-1]RDI96426.1 hypothetical protein DV704_00950 [Meiothermus sp. QL-1]